MLLCLLLAGEDEVGVAEGGGGLIPRLFPTSPTAAATPVNDPPPLGQPYSGDVCNYGPIYNAAYNYAAAVAASKAAAAARASPYSRGAFPTSPCTSSPAPPYPQPPTHLHHHPFGASYGASARSSAFEYPPR